MNEPQSSKQVIMKIEKCGFTGNQCYGDPASHYEYGANSGGLRYHYKLSAVKAIEYGIAQLQEAFKKDTEIHQKNIPAIENNKAIAKRIADLMEEVKIPKSYSERDSKSRARYPKQIIHNAGYLGDIARNCTVGDGYEYSESKYKEYISIYTRKLEEAKKQEEVEKRAIENEEKNKLEARKKDIEFAALLVRYNLPIESEWEDILDALRNKNKYIDLAFAMRQVRGDWNDGCDPVEGALSGFTATTTIDKEIEKCVSEAIDNFNGDCRDGRIFRDCGWNYDAILGQVKDEVLLKDAELAYEKWSSKKYGY